MFYSKRLKQVFISKKMFRCIFYSGIPALLFFSISLVGLWAAGFSLMEILKDPAQQSGQSSFLGFISNIGVWLWVSSAAICLFSALSRNLVTKRSQRELLFLIGILSTFLAIDDFFMIHDRYISQELCYLAYALCVGALLTRHYKMIIEIDGFSFLLAGLLLALSILSDLIQGNIPLRYLYSQIIEEGFKFTGAAIWLYFSCSVASFRPTSSIKMN